MLSLRVVIAQVRLAQTRPGDSAGLLRDILDLAVRRGQQGILERSEQDYLGQTLPDDGGGGAGHAPGVPQTRLPLTAVISDRGGGIESVAIRSLLVREQISTLMTFHSAGIGSDDWFLCCCCLYGCCCCKAC